MVKWAKGTFAKKINKYNQHTSKFDTDYCDMQHLLNKLNRLEEERNHIS